MRDDEFTVFAASHWSTMVRTARMLGCDPQEAGDVARAAMVTCYLAWGAVEKARSPTAYATTVLVNPHRASRRRHWWRERPTESVPEDPAAASVPSLDEAHDLGLALRELSPAHREVIVLRYYCDLSEQQIAETLRVATGTVKSRLSRALGNLASSTHLHDLHQEGG